MSLFEHHNFQFVFLKWGGGDLWYTVKKQRTDIKAKYKDIKDNRNIQPSTGKRPSGHKPETSKTPSTAISPVLPLPRSASKMI